MFDVEPRSYMLGQEQLTAELEAAARAMFKQAPNASETDLCALIQAATPWIRCSDLDIYAAIKSLNG